MNGSPARVQTAAYTKVGAELYIPSTLNVHSSAPLQVTLRGAESTPQAPYVTIPVPWLKVVAWDVYGVLYEEGGSPGVGDVSQWIAAEVQKSTVQVEEVVFGRADGLQLTPDQELLQARELNPEIFLSRALLTLGMPYEKARDFAWDVMSLYVGKLTETLNWPLVELARELNAYGIRSCIITDRTVLASRAAERVSGFLTPHNFFEVISSHNVRAQKPYRQIFDAAIAAARMRVDTSLRAFEISMVDDRRYNLLPDDNDVERIGAVGYGMTGVLYSGKGRIDSANEELRQVFRYLNIPV
jgi:FMN phosphatase YigB (HAD superfamily)